jgi:hypothetical protein
MIVAAGAHIPRKPRYTDPGESESYLMLGRIGLGTVEWDVLMDSEHVMTINKGKELKALKH